MKTERIFVALALLAGALLAACSPAQPPIPATLPPAPSSTPVELPTATTAPTDPVPTGLALDCQDQANLNDGPVRAENNTWGKGTLTDWTQCIGLHAAEDGTLTARWTWDWPIYGNNVKAYPEVIFGQKPGGPSTTADLPKQVDSLSQLLITYDVTSTHTGSGNLAFDIWLTDTADPSTWGVPPINTEIMIWLESFGSMGPGGSWQEQTAIDGTNYSVYTAKNWGDGWNYVAFYRTKPQTGAGSLDLVSFLAYMKDKGLVTGQEYVASVEFGNEVAYGTGETNLSKFSVSVR